MLATVSLRVAASPLVIHSHLVATCPFADMTIYIMICLSAAQRGPHVSGVGAMSGQGQGCTICNYKGCQAPYVTAWYLNGAPLVVLVAAICCHVMSCLHTLHVEHSVGICCHLMSCKHKVLYMDMVCCRGMKVLHLVNSI